MRDPRGRRPIHISRREFLRRSAASAVAFPTAAAILAACGGNGGDGGPTGGATGGAGAVGTGGIPGGPYPLARQDAPVTWTIFDDNPPIEDGLQPEAGPLKIFGYNDYIWKKVRNRFEDELGAKIQYTVFDTPEEMVAKVQSGTADFDLIVTVTLDNVGKLVAGKLIQPLNHSYLPNFEKNVWPSLRSPYYDRESRYTVPYTLYTTGITWRNDKVTEDIAAMDNPYDALFDTEHAGKVHLLNGARDTISVALLRNGVTDVNTEDAAVLDQAKQTLLEGVDAMNWKFDHTDYNELGQFDIHHTWSGQVAYYQYYLPEGLTIDKFSYVWPPRGAGRAPGLLQDDVFAIPTASKNPVLAHAMIDFLLDESNGIDNYSYEGFQPPLNAIEPDRIVDMELVPPNLANIVITEDDFSVGLATLELTPQGTQAWQSIYQEVTGGA
jgi:spermidine/putrescine transport system substrate-binding protein